MGSCVPGWAAALFWFDAFTVIFAWHFTNRYKITQMYENNRKIMNEVCRFAHRKLCEILINNSIQHLIYRNETGK